MGDSKHLVKHNLILFGQLFRLLVLQNYVHVEKVSAINIPCVDRFQADKTGVSLIDIPHLFHKKKTSTQMTKFLDYTFEEQFFS